MSLWDGNTLTNSAILDANGTATVSLNSLSVGDHTLTARYDGDANFHASTSSVVNEQVRYPTTVTINSNGSTTLLGVPVVFTTNVQSPSGTPTGSVAFYDGARLLGQVTLANGAATFSAASLADGTHAVTAPHPAIDLHSEQRAVS